METTDMSGNEIARIPERRPAETQPTVQPAPADLHSVVKEIMGGLGEPLATADDVNLELSAGTEPNRSYARLSLRCYKHGRKIVDEERNG
jgi:hypothetical protein